MARAALILAAVALLAASCGAKARTLRLKTVERVLVDAKLRPERVRLEVTISTRWSPPRAINYCAAESAAPASGTSLSVDGGRATVMVFENEKAADEWVPAPECPVKPLRVRNVIAVVLPGRDSPRLRRVLHELARR